jgi:hypothetical protein
VPERPDVWTAYRKRKNGVVVMYGVKERKLADAPAELHQAITWTGKKK